MIDHRTSRRTILGGAAAAALAAGLARRLPVLAGEGTPTAGAGGSMDAAGYPELAITVKDDGFHLPATVPAGRYRVGVTNASAGGSHLSLGRFPDDWTEERIALLFDDDPTNDGTTPEFFSIQFVGLPDWPKPGQSAHGVIDLPAGRYLAIDPISEKQPSRLDVTGGAGTPAPDPQAAITITLEEMSVAVSGAVAAGKQTWQVVNNGGFTHEVVALPVAPGTTNDDLTAYMEWAMQQPQDGTPTSAPPTGDKIDLMTYEPSAAMSLLHPGGVSWVEVDLAAGAYALLCMVPGPTDDVPPHAFMGMHTVIEVA